MTLAEFFRANPDVAIAFSGGVDSSYLLYAATRYARRVCAYFVRSEFQPAFAETDARRLALELNAEFRVVPLVLLSQPEIAANTAERCYYCKRAIFTALRQAAANDGLTLLCDGTNASDALAERPGLRALPELGVRSPLRECSLSKADIRRASREAGLSFWDKPAYSCLATRTPAGEALSYEILAATEAAENALAALGLRDFRVRQSRGQARLQVRSEDLACVLAKREEILAALKPFYKTISLDLEVRP